MTENLSQTNPSSQSFNFLKLDNRLNTKKLQQKKKQQHDKNVLSVYQKNLPNLQFVNRCNNIMTLYKNHYNINRRFSVFYDAKSSKNQNNQEDQKNQDRLPSILLQRSQSTQSFSAQSKISTQKNTTLVEAEKLMKPIKTNQYVNEKGFIKLTQKPTLSQIKKSSPLEMTPNLFVSSSSFRNNLHKNILSLTKDQNTQPPGQFTPFENQKKVSKIKSTKERKKQLKVNFRKTILLIIEKMKAMKITFSEIIQKDPFDKKTPYKFGDDIFMTVKLGHEPKVFRIMLQNRLSIFSIDTTGKTTLMWACIRGYVEIVQLLLSNGVETHLRDINGKTALFFAIKYNYVKCAKYLFIYSKYLEPDIQSLQMSQQMRKMVRIGLSTHKFFNTFKIVQKKREYFEQEYRYYFKQ